MALNISLRISSPWPLRTKLQPKSSKKGLSVVHNEIMEPYYTADNIVLRVSEGFVSGAEIHCETDISS